MYDDEPIDLFVTGSDWEGWRAFSPNGGEDASGRTRQEAIEAAKALPQRRLAEVVARLDDIASGGRERYPGEKLALNQDGARLRRLLRRIERVGWHVVVGGGER